MTTSKVLCPTLDTMLKKTILALCEVNIRYDCKLEISGSLHIRSDGEKVITFLIDEEMRSPLNNRAYCSSVGSGDGNSKHRNGIEGIAESLMNRASMQQNLKCITNSLSAAVTDLLPHSSSNGSNSNLNLPELDETGGNTDAIADDSLATNDTVSICNSHRKMQYRKSSVDVNSSHESGVNGTAEIARRPEHGTEVDDSPSAVMADSTCQGSTGNPCPPDVERADDSEKSSDVDVQPSQHRSQNALGLLSDIADALQRGQSVYGGMEIDAMDRNTKDNTNYNNLDESDMARGKRSSALVGEEQEPGEVTADRAYMSGKESPVCRRRSSVDCRSISPPVVNGAPVSPDIPPYYGSTSGSSMMTGLPYSTTDLPNPRDNNHPLMHKNLGMMLPSQFHTSSSATLTSPGLQPVNMLSTPSIMLQQQLHHHHMSLSAAAAAAAAAAAPPPPTGPINLSQSTVKQEAAPPLLSPLFMNPLQAAHLGGIDMSHTSPPLPSQQSLPPPVPPRMPQSASSSPSRPIGHPPRTIRSHSSGSTSSSKSNNGNKKWQCMFCGIMVSSKFYLSSHINAVHTRTRVYPCELCGKVFYSHGAQRIHKLRNHWVEKRHKCPHCSQLFVLPFELRQHIQRKHKNIQK